jgi:hypothetical protein
MTTELRLYDNHKSPPITLPSIKLPPIDHALKVELQTERNIIRAGLDAWRSIGKAESFDNWKAIGAALAIGKAVALRATGANRAWGRNYSRVFCDWVKQHRFDAMPASVRSAAIELHENIDPIMAWRETLSEKERCRLIHPLSNVRRWQAASKTKPNALLRAERAWQRFKIYVKELPEDQAKPLMLDVCKFLHAQPNRKPTGALNGHRMDNPTTNIIREFPLEHPCP